jgi:hypothetical protein
MAVMASGHVEAVTLDAGRGSLRVVERRTDHHQVMEVVIGVRDAVA